MELKVAGGTVADKNKWKIYSCVDRQRIPALNFHHRGTEKNPWSFGDKTGHSLEGG